MNPNLIREIRIQHNVKPSYYFIVFTVDEKIHKSGINLSKELKELGIITDVYRYQYKLLPDYPIFKEYGFTNNANHFINANHLISNILVLPTHEDISVNKIEEFCKTISQYVDKLMLQVK